MFFVERLLNLWICDLATLKNTLSILHSPRLLAAGHLGNIIIMESIYLLPVGLTEATLAKLLINHCGTLL